MKNLFYLLLLSCTTVFYAQKNKKQWETDLMQASRLIELGQYADAQDPINKAFAFAQNNFDKNSLEFSSTAFYHGFVAFQLENFPTAATSFEVAKSYYQNQSSTTDETYLQLLNYLAIAYTETQQFLLAEKTYTELMTVAEKTLGATSIDYGIILTNVAGFYKDTYQFLKALSYFEAGMKILEPEPSFPANYKQNLKYNNLPFIYEGLGRFEEALDWQKQALKDVIDNFGRISSHTANVLAHMGNLYMHLGDFEPAQKSLAAASIIFEQLADDTQNEAHGNVQMGLAKLYTLQNNYQEAIDYALSGLELTGYYEGRTPKNLLNYLEIIAELHQNLGQHYAAIHHYEKALALAENSHGTTGVAYLKIKANLGQLHFNYGDEDLGKNLLQSAFETVKKHHQAADEVYWYVSYLYIPVLIANQKYTEAIGGINLILKHIPQNSLSRFTYEITLAELYLYAKDYAKALTILQKNESKLRNIFDQSHEKIIKLNHLKIMAKYGLGQVNDLPALISANSQNIKHQLRNIFEFGSEYENEAFLKMTQNYFDDYQSFNSNKKIARQLHEINLNNHLLIKGILLENKKNRLQMLADLKDEEVQTDLKAYLNYKTLISQLKTETTEDVAGEKVSDIYAKSKYYESELNKHFHKHFGSAIDWDYNWQSIKQKLAADEVAVDFVSYRHFDGKNTEVKYLAFIIDHASAYPLLIELTNEEKLQNHLKSHEHPNQLYATRGSHSRSVGQANDRFLFEHIWQPILSKISNKTTIYLSPDGLLHQISHGAIRNEQGRFLLDDYRLVWLNNLKNLKTKDNFVPKSILLFGGIVYDLTTEQQHDKHWDYLPGTLEEVNAIYDCFDKQNKRVGIYTAHDATENILRREVSNLMRCCI